ncbi:MAG: nitroreductase family deazaflavin-dependent oxidoreductase [Dehalococcoidia bacterium]
MTRFYNPPSRFTKTLNAVLGWLGARGLGPKRLVQLEHKGRKSGKTFRTAVTTTEYEGQRYLVAPRGETQWVRNVKANGGQAVVKHGKTENVRLEEIPPEQRAPIIKQYLGENKVIKGEFGLEPDDPLEKYAEIATKHPVFRIHPA